MDLGSAIDEIGWIRYHYYIFLISGCSWASDLIWQLNMAIILDDAGDEWNLSSFTKGVMSTIFMTGMVLGSYFWGHIADKKGRKFAFKKTLIPVIIGGVLGLFSPNYWMLTICSFIVGLGAGGEVSVGTTIYSEFCPSNKQWTLVLLGLCWCLGGMISPALAAILESVDTHGISIWRWVIGISVFLTVCMFISRLFMMETPRFLFNKNKYEQCKEVLNSMKEGNYELIEQEQEEEDQAPISYLFSRPWIRLTVIYCILFFGSNFASGGVLFFMPELIDNIGSDLSDQATYLIVFIQQSSGIPGVLVAAYLVSSRLGRKWTMNIGYIICGVFLILFLGSVTISMLIVTSSVMVFFSYIGYCAMYEILPETYPTFARSTAMGLGNAHNKIGAILSPLVYGLILEVNGGYYYVLAFSSIAYIAIGFVGFLVIETKDKKLDFAQFETEYKQLVDTGDLSNRVNKSG